MSEVEASRLLVERAKFACTCYGVSWSLFQRKGAEALRRRQRQDQYQQLLSRKGE